MQAWECIDNIQGMNGKMIRYVYTSCIMYGKNAKLSIKPMADIPFTEVTKTRHDRVPKSNMYLIYLSFAYQG